MYEAYFGLKEKPFNLSPDPSFLYMSPGHENVYSHLEYAVRENKGFAVITGEVGSGKTTLINYLIKSLGSDYRVGLISNTDLTPDQLMQMIMLEFGLSGSPAGDRASQLNEWTNFLAQQGAKSQKVILIIDEAQNLPLPTLEGLRMLSNFEGEREQLMQIILVGQPELRDKLKTREFRQLSQRVTVHAHLESLSANDVYNYINHRLKIAGANNPEAIFTPEAIEQINQYSKGLPRIINYLCDTAMVYAFADELKVISGETVASVVATRQIGGLMPDLDPEPQTGPAPETGAGGGNLLAGAKADFDREPVLARLAVLEHRVLTLEETLKSQSETGDSLVELMRRASQRDGIMLELLKMLNENLAGRQQALGRLYNVYKARKNEAPLAKPLVSRPNNPLNAGAALAAGPSAPVAKPLAEPPRPLQPVKDGNPAAEPASPAAGEVPAPAGGVRPENQPAPEKPEAHEVTFVPDRRDSPEPKEDHPAPPEPAAPEPVAEEAAASPKPRSFFSRFSGRKE